MLKDRIKEIMDTRSWIIWVQELSCTHILFTPKQIIKNLIMEVLFMILNQNEFWNCEAHISHELSEKELSTNIHLGT